MKNYKELAKHNLNWDIIKNHLPGLKKNIEEMLQ